MSAGSGEKEVSAAGDAAHETAAMETGVVPHACVRACVRHAVRDGRVCGGGGDGCGFYINGAPVPVAVAHIS